MCWEGPYIVITRINDVIYRSQRDLRAKMMVATWTDWCHTWGLLGKSSLGEGAV
jgi:hypothetical protein